MPWILLADIGAGFATQCVYTHTLDMPSMNIGEGHPRLLAQTYGFKAVDLGRREGELCY